MSKNKHKNRQLATETTQEQMQESEQKTNIILNDVNDPEMRNMITKINEISNSKTNTYSTQSMEQSQIVPYVPPLFDASRPYIQFRINEAGVLAGAIAASITYTATQTAVSAAGTATSLAVNTAGFLLGHAAGFTVGAAAKTAVDLTATVAAETAKGALQLQSTLAAVAVSSVVGATTALAVSASSSIIGAGVSLIGSGASYIYSKLPSKESLYSLTGGFIKNKEVIQEQSGWDKVD